MKNTPDADFLIFDLGNVIIDIDYAGTLSRIRQELPVERQHLVEGFYLTAFHRQYERGLIDSYTFREEIRAYFGQNWSDQKIDDLWNSLLGKIPKKRLDLVRRVREQYQVGVLSNTNLIHIHAVNAILHRDFDLPNFDPIFDWVFLSHEMGLAKPDSAIYERMLTDLGTAAERVVFFDDLKDNVDGAASLGIQAVHVTGPEVIFDFLKHV